MATFWQTPHEKGNLFVSRQKMEVQFISQSSERGFLLSPTPTHPPPLKPPDMVMAVYFGLDSLCNSETTTTVYQQAADQGSRWPFIFKQAALWARNHNLPTSKRLWILWPEAGCQSQLRTTFQAGAFSVIGKHHNDDCRYWLFFHWLLWSQI